MLASGEDGADASLDQVELTRADDAGIRYSKGVSFEKVESGGDAGALRNLLGIESCQLVLDKFSIDGGFDPISLHCNPGEVVLFVSPPSSSKSSAALLYALAGQSGRLGFKPDDIKGQAFAITNDHKIDLVTMHSPMLNRKTSLYRKATPLEVMSASLAINGEFTSATDRAKVFAAMKEDFGELLDVDGTILCSKYNVGDRDVEEGNAPGRCRDKCCQLFQQLSALERRKLEFMCDFVICHRPDIMYMNGLSDLDSRERAAYRSFLGDVAHGSGRTTIVLRVDDLTGRTLDLCDKLVVLSNGKTTFAGPKDQFPAFLENTCSNVVSMGNALWSQSPGEFFLESCDESEENLVARGGAQVDVDALCKHFASSQVCTQVTERARDTIQRHKDLEMFHHVHQSSFSKRWLCVFLVTFRREHKNYYRTSGLTTLRALLYFVFAIMVAIVANQSSLLETGRRIWLLIAFFDFTVAASLFGMFALRLERKTLFHEARSGRVSLSAWMSGHFFGGLIGVAYTSLLPGLASFYLLKLNVLDSSAMAVISYTLNFWLITALCEQLWVMVALLIPQKKNATIIASFFALAFVLGQSIFTKIADLPANRYVLFISLFRPAMETFFSKIFAGDQPLYFLPQSWSSNPDCWADPNNTTRVFTTREVLDCLDTAVWTKCETEPEFGTKWTGDEALECLKYGSNVAFINALVSVGVTLFIRFITFCVVKWQLRKSSGYKKYKHPIKE